ncbi:Oxidoreductase calM [Paramyrothecium foliicola]|nr:Oxidoreductase calM [Paramyrothecium foliicola]
MRGAKMVTSNKLFVLAEIIKASRIDVESLVHFIKYHNIEPDWMNMQIPLGRNMNQCMQFAEHISITTSSLKRRPSSDDFGHPSKRLAFSDMPEQTRPTSSPGILQPAPPPPPPSYTAYTTAHTTPSNGFIETSPQPPVPVMAKKRGRPSRADKAKRDLRPLLPQHLAPRPPPGAAPPQVPSPPAARPILPAIGSPRDFRRGPLDPRSWSPPSLYRVSPGVEEKSPARHQERIVEGDHSRPTNATMAEKMISLLGLEYMGQIMLICQWKHAKTFQVAPENARVTGCSSGIGHALASLIAKHYPKQRLVATARDPASISLPASAPGSPPGRILLLSLDVTLDASIGDAVDAALAAFGRIDVLVNNAGYGLMGDTEATTDEQARRQVETNFWGTARLCVHAMRVMREDNAREGGRQGGLVMNVTSMGGFFGFPGHAYYHASKFAVEGFTESIAKEVRPEWNIHFTLIEPGGVQTNYTTTSAVTPPVHPAYAASDSPTRTLLAYVHSPEARATWALPQSVAESMYHVASRGGKIPLRVPLGRDAWSFMRQEIETLGKELDDVRAISEGAAGGTENENASLNALVAEKGWLS